MVEPVWEDAGYASEGFISVSDGAAYGYIDYKGSVFITPQYEVAAEFSDGAAYVQRERVGMLINMEGDVIFENVYSGLVEGLAITRDENGWGFVDALGKIAVACEWEDVDLPSEGLIGVRSSGKWGFINKDGETEIDFTWDYVWPFSNGLAIVATTTDGYAIDKYGFINSVGEQIVPCTYDSAKPFSDGRAAVCRDGLWGYVDVLGSEIVPCAYAYAADFHDNFAAVGNNGVLRSSTRRAVPVTFYREDEAPITPPPGDNVQTPQGGTRRNAGRARDAQAAGVCRHHHRHCCRGRLFCCSSPRRSSCAKSTSGGADAVGSSPADAEAREMRSAMSQVRPNSLDA